MTSSLMELDILRRDLSAPPPGTPADLHSPARRSGRHDWDTWLNRGDNVENSPGIPAAQRAGADRRRTGRGRRGNHRRTHRLADLVDVIRAVRIVPWT